MSNPLLDALRMNNSNKKNSKSYFDANTSIISYSTGFPVLDYYLGYKLNVVDKKGKVVDTYPSVGITGGSYILFIGKSNTAKTSTAIEIAANIIRPFKNGFVLHLDLEQAANYSRIQALTKYKMQDIRDKYIIRQEQITLSDIKQSIMQIVEEKTNNPDKYKYNTNKKNEFNEDIIIFEPTVIILDSIGSISAGIGDKKISELEDVSSQPDRMRLTGEITRFINEIMPYLRMANIILIGINHIKQKSSMNSFIPQPADIIGLKQDETVTGGRQILNLANILIRFSSVGSEKFNVDDHGFSGFGVKADIIKSRVSSSLKGVNLIYDMNTGIDMVRSTVRYASDMGLIGGNKNNYYFITNKEDKFTLRNMTNDFKNNPKLYKIMKDNVIPLLEDNLSGLLPEEMEIPNEELNFYNL